MCTIILQTKVWRVSFFHFAGIFELPTFKVISFAMLAETNFFFGAFLYSAQDLSHKIGKSWTWLIRVSISLIVEVHGVDGVREGVVIWVDPILFVSVADSFSSPKVLKLYNQRSERSCISTICCKSVFRKAIENIRNMYWSSVPTIWNFVLIFVLFSWRDKYQRNEKFNWFFLITKGEKV